MCVCIRAVGGVVARQLQDVRATCCLGCRTLVLRGFVCIHGLEEGLMQYIHDTCYFGVKV